MSDFVLTPAAQADVLRIIDFLEGDNPSAILRVVWCHAEPPKLNPALGALVEHAWWKIRLVENARSAGVRHAVGCRSGLATQLARASLACCPDSAVLAGDLTLVSGYWEPNEKCLSPPITSCRTGLAATATMKTIFRFARSAIGFGGSTPQR
jgi:hypothetical protein